MIKSLQMHLPDFCLWTTRFYPRTSQTFLYLICPWWLSTPTRWSWGGCCSSSWAVLSDVSGNKVWLRFKLSTKAKSKHICLLFAVLPKSQNPVTFALWSYTRLIFFFRIHSDHHDFGGVCAACCHDSHPRGQSLRLELLSWHRGAFLKMIVNICMQQNCSSLAFFSLQLMSKETTSPFAAELSGDLEQQVSIVATFMETQNRQIVDKSSSMKQQLLSNTFSAAFLMAGPLHLYLLSGRWTTLHM